MGIEVGSGTRLECDDCPLSFGMRKKKSAGSGITESDSNKSLQKNQPRIVASKRIIKEMKTANKGKQLQIEECHSR